MHFEPFKIRPFPTGIFTSAQFLPPYVLNQINKPSNPRIYDSLDVKIVTRFGLFRDYRVGGGQGD